MALESFLLQWFRNQQWIQLHTLSLIPFLLLFFFTLLVLQRLNRSSSPSKPNLPPSPPKFPIIGNIHQLGTLLHRSLRDLSHKYGPIMLLHLGKVPVVVISSADIAREIMKDHDVVFANRPFTLSAKMLLYGCNDVGFSPYGEHWRKMRRICVMDLLSTKRVQSFKFVREEEIAFMVEKISNACLKKCQINLSEMLFALSKDIICRCVLGRKYGDQEDGKEGFTELPRKVSELLVEFSFGDVFPCLKWMDVVTGFVRRLKRTSQELDTFFEQVIEEHISGRKEGNLNKEDDFVDLLLQIQDDKNLDINLTRDNIKALLLDMFVAGSETTATTLEWAIAELAKNQDKMKKAQKEVRRLVGEKSVVVEEDIKQMNYLKCIVKETLRLHPAIPTLLPHESSADTNVGGYNIPHKTRVLINAWAIQRDTKVWSKAEEFIPERFVDNVADFRGQDFEFIPFGAGRRICPGMSFGLAVVELTIANLLYWFDWALPGGANQKELDMRESFGIGVAKKIPLNLVPIFHFS